MGDYTHLSISDRRRFYTLLEMKLPITEVVSGGFSIKDTYCN